ncbi:peptidase inhibitor family I36 protein [Kitasatospora sp. NPDC049258]|uniref:peptidase inhibitor family I36 protein n=1 Tax=Kitasatospora sp. NPDC049258 TaxID=3155394 RepID=UPI003437439C
MLANRHRLPHRLISALIATAAAAVLGLTGAATAGAAELNGYTDNGEFSLYSGPGTTAMVLDLYVSKDNLGYLSWPVYGGNPNDRNESYWNNDSFTWHVYTDPNRGGRHGWINPGVISDASSNFRHQVSSAYYTG